MEGFKLDIPRPFFQHVHHKLQIVRIWNIPCHNLNVKILYIYKSIKTYWLIQLYQLKQIISIFQILWIFIKRLFANSSRVSYWRNDHVFLQYYSKQTVIELVLSAKKTSRQFCKLGKVYTNRNEWLTEWFSYLNTHCIVANYIKKNRSSADDT